MIRPPYIIGFGFYIFFSVSSIVLHYFPLLHNRQLINNAEIARKDVFYRKYDHFIN